jgi:predicted metal-dependent phosphoesterase TrpH
MMHFDLHIHTCYSYDCTLSLQKLADVVRRRGLDGIAVLDHDEIDGALRLREWAPFQVIIGEEIGTLHGGVAGLFLQDRIPPHLTVEEAIARIHAQGGLVFMPHPLARGVPGRIEEAKLHEVIGQVDLLEGYNARTPLASDDRRARELAARHGIPVAAGSDGHFPCEIGRAWTELRPFQTPQEFLSSLRSATLHYTTKTPFLVPALTVASIAPLTLRRAWRQRHGAAPGAYHN